MKQKQNINLKQLFTDFLKENNIHKKFYATLKLQNSWKNYTEVQFLNEFLNSHYAPHVFEKLCWTLSIDGFDFWFNIHCKWNILIFKSFLPLLIYNFKKYNLYGNAISSIYKIPSMYKVLAFTEIESYPYRVCFKENVLTKKEFAKMHNKWMKIVENI